MTRKVIRTDQIGGDFSIRYFKIMGSTEIGADHGHRVETTGKISALAEEYKTYCERTTVVRHGPATLTLPGETDEVGFINALGHVYLNQEQHKRIL